MILRKFAGFTLHNFIDTTGPVRLVGRLVWLTPVIGVGYAIIVILTTIFGAPYAYNLLNQTCEDDCSFFGQLTTTNAQDLQSIGISVNTYAIFYIVILGIFTVVCVAVAGLILWKKPGELLPFCAAYYILALPSDTGQILFFGNLFKDHQTLGAFFTIFSLPNVLISYYLLLAFPGGKFKGKIFAWFFIGLVICYAANFVYAQVSGTDSSDTNSISSLALYGSLAFITLAVLFYREKNFSILNIAKYLGFIALCVLSVVFEIGLGAIVLYILVIYRYSTVLTPRERNSTKWLILSFSVLLFALTVGLGLLPLIPALVEPGTFYFLLFNFLAFFGCAINETGLLIGVLYANAFDINLVIKRTLVYTTLTILIIGTYLGSIIGLQALVQGITGQQSDLAIVGATLISLLVFQPLRRVIQHFIDRRFYRRKYDASRTIAELNNQLKAETDLKTLASSLRGVLDETLQPEHVTVWFRKRSTNSPS